MWGIDDDCHFIAEFTPGLGRLDDTLFVHYGTHLRTFDGLSLAFSPFELELKLAVDGAAVIFVKQW